MKICIFLLQMKIWESRKGLITEDLGEFEQFQFEIYLHNWVVFPDEEQPFVRVKPERANIEVAV